MLESFLCIAKTCYKTVVFNVTNQYFFMKTKMDKASIPVIFLLVLLLIIKQ